MLKFFLVCREDIREEHGPTKKKTKKKLRKGKGKGKEEGGRGRAKRKKEKKGNQPKPTASLSMYKLFVKLKSLSAHRNRNNLYDKSTWGKEERKKLSVLKWLKCKLHIKHLLTFFAIVFSVF